MVCLPCCQIQDGEEIKRSLLWDVIRGIGALVCCQSLYCNANTSRVCYNGEHGDTHYIDLLTL